jgi:hypothetical protein
MKTLLVVLFVLIIPAVTFAATIEVPVQFVVPDRELTAAERSFLATVPLEATGRLHEAVEQMLKAGVCHVPSDGKYNASDPACNSVHYWTLYQAWTGPHKIILTMPELPSQPVCITPPPPLPPVINVCPRVEVPQCPPPVVNNYLSCPTERRAQLQPHAGAQRVYLNYGGADVMVGWGSGKSRQRFCPPFPDQPIVPPPVPAPPY